LVGLVAVCELGASFGGEIDFEAAYLFGHE